MRSLFERDGVDAAGDDEVVAHHDAVPVLLGGPAADPEAPGAVHGEVLGDLAVVRRQVVLGEQVGDHRRLGDLGRAATAPDPSPRRRGRRSSGPRPTACSRADSSPCASSCAARPRPRRPAATPEGGPLPLIVLLDERGHASHTVVVAWSGSSREPKVPSWRSRSRVRRGLRYRLTHVADSPRKRPRLPRRRPRAGPAWPARSARHRRRPRRWSARPPPSPRRSSASPPTAPDVAVLDVRLPDGNGVELCREVRSRQPTMRLPDADQLRRRRRTARRRAGRCLRLRAQADPRPQPGRRGAHRRPRAARCSTTAARAALLARLRDGRTTPPIRSPNSPTTSARSST